MTGILADSDFSPHHPWTLAQSPPFFKILPRCPSNSPAPWGDRTDLCYDPGRWLAREPGQQAQQPDFDASSLQAYLEASPVSARSANNLTLVPEPASVFLLLTGLLTLARIRF